MRKRKWLPAIAAMAALGILSACGGSNAANGPAPPQNGTVVVMGTDYPTLGNVVSFGAPISGITLTSNGGSQVSVMNAPATIDFARLVGLQTLIDLQPVPQGTYTSATINFGGNPTLEVLNDSSLYANPPVAPSVQNLSAAFSAMTVTVNFPQALNVGASQVLGLLLDFRLDKSIPVDSSGNIVVGTNGVVTVTPVIVFRFIDPQQAKMEIDDLRGGVTSIGSNGTFVMQGPYGRQFTVETDSTTMWEPSGQSFSTLSTSDIVVVEDGIVDPATLMVKAREIDVIPDKFVVTGLVTFVNPAATPSTGGCAPTVSLLVRASIPGSTTYPSGTIANIGLTGTETYWVGHRDWIGSLFQVNFNSCALVPGQALLIGGTADSSGNLTPKRVVLTVQGFAGTAASGVGSDGTFTFNAKGLAGTLLPSPVTVQTISNSLFSTELENLADLGAIGSGTELHVAGLVLFNPTTNTTNILAGRIAQPEN